jgi:hypothetical protein
LGEFDGKPNHIKDGEGCKAKDSFFNHLAKKYVQWVQNV